VIARQDEVLGGDFKAGTVLSMRMPPDGPEAWRAEDADIETAPRRPTKSWRAR